MCIKMNSKPGISHCVLMRSAASNAWASIPETLQFLQFIWERVRFSFSPLITTESVNVGDLCSTPACHYASPFIQIQTEVLCICQTDWSETKQFLSPSFAFYLQHSAIIDLMWEKVALLKSMGVSRVRRPTSYFTCPRVLLMKNLECVLNSVSTALDLKVSVSVSASISCSPEQEIYFKTCFTI